VSAPTPTFRPATADDLSAIVAMLADDILGSAREGDPADPAYRAAFAAIMADPNELLAVAEIDGAAAGCLQIGFIPGLSRKGAWRGQIEGVRVAGRWRGRGMGAAMIRWAVAQCRARGCATVQLTTDKRRHDAHRFYERLGFIASHEGMKLTL
jgi:ribosomal protein S18 acetylase RimI-like enzyme